MRIFDESGVVKGQFFAFSTTFRGGVTIATADFTGDARAEIVVGSGRGGSPTVRVFDRLGAQQSQFLAYASSFTGGVEVATGDVDGDGTPEIVTGAGPGGGPHVRIFDKNGTVKAQFFAFDTTYRGGVRLTAADLDGDRKAEIIVVRGAADQSEVRIFASNGTLKGSFAAFVPARRVTMGVGSLDRDSDGRAELLVGAGGTDASLRGFSPQGALLIAFPLPAELTSGLRLVTF